MTTKPITLAIENPQTNVLSYAHNGQDYKKWIESKEQEVSRDEIINKIKRFTCIGTEEKLYEYLDEIEKNEKEVSRNRILNLPEQKLGMLQNLVQRFSELGISLPNTESVLNQHKQEIKENKEELKAMNDDTIFQLIGNNILLDKNDMETQYNYMGIINKFRPVGLNLVFAKMNDMADALINKILQTNGILNDMPVEKRKNFAFHVICKGKEFYEASIIDPDFCLYLINDKEPWYSSFYDAFQKLVM